MPHTSPQGFPLSSLLVAKALRSGICPNDASFDCFLADDLRVVSRLYWTPLSAVVCAARWLEQAKVHRVLDVGSGAGKFCVAAALATNLHFIGLEHRGRLVREARALAQRFGVDHRVQFVEGALTARQLPPADAYYLYNPFGENLFGVDDHLDGDVEVSPSRYEKDVAFMEDVLAAAPIDTVLLTYNGFGGQIPRDYQLICENRYLPNTLAIWRKASPIPRT